MPYITENKERDPHDFSDFHPHDIPIAITRSAQLTAAIARFQLVEELHRQGKMTAKELDQAYMKINQEFHWLEANLRVIMKVVVRKVGQAEYEQEKLAQGKQE